MHYKHTIYNKNQTSTIKLILSSHTNSLHTARGLEALHPDSYAALVLYIYNMA